MAHRIQSRRGNGRFRRNTLGNTFGLDNEVCGCGQMHPYKLGTEQPPLKCVSCGIVLPWVRQNYVLESEEEAADDLLPMPRGTDFSDGD